MGRATDKLASANWENIGAAVYRLGYGMETGNIYGVELTGMSVRFPGAEGGEFLLVLRGIDEEGGPIVAFHSAVGFDQALVGLQNRLANGSLKWRPDEYAQR